MDDEFLRLSVYDFDGTLFHGDSSVKFWFFMLGKRPWMLILLPWFLVLLILHGVGLMDRHHFKQAIYIVVDGVRLSRMRQLVDMFVKKERRNIYPWAKERISKEIKDGFIIVCVSASPCFLIEGMVRSLGISHLICTELETNNGRQSNRIIGRHCRGKEKIYRLEKWAANRPFVVERFCSDSLADLPLYEIARQSFYVKNGKVFDGMPSRL